MSVCKKSFFQNDGWKQSFEAQKSTFISIKNSKYNCEYLVQLKKYKTLLFRMHLNFSTSSSFIALVVVLRYVEGNDITTKIIIQ